MAATLVQIQARLGSTRLPGKVLYPLHDRRVLGWVVYRCEAATSVGDVVVAVGDRPENEAIAEWCRRIGVSHTIGPEENLLERHLHAAERMGADRIIRITGDCPFVPPDEIDRVVVEHASNGARYTTNVTDRMPIGTGVDVIEWGALEELRAVGARHPVRCLREDSERWDSAFSPNPKWVEYDDVHMAVDTPKDYWRLVDALTAVGSDPIAVAEWLSQQ